MLRRLCHRMESDRQLVARSHRQCSRILTGGRLLELQMKDAVFRREIALQLLIFLAHALNPLGNVEAMREMLLKIHGTGGECKYERFKGCKDHRCRSSSRQGRRCHRRRILHRLPPPLLPASSQNPLPPHTPSQN